MQEKFIEQQLSLTDQHWHIMWLLYYHCIIIQIKSQISVKTS